MKKRQVGVFEEQTRWEEKGMRGSHARLFAFLVPLPSSCFPPTLRDKPWTFVFRNHLVKMDFLAPVWKGQTQHRLTRGDTHAMRANLELKQVSVPSVA